MIDLTIVESPIGPLTMAVRNARLCLLHFGADVAAATVFLQRWYPAEGVTDGEGTQPVEQALTRYFCGEIDALERTEVELNGTPFQRRVWSALRAVAPGSTTSYGEIARGIEAPSSVRAVGAANGANPIAIIVPCHRIIGRSGSLTGYGGGLERKEWLLRHEGAARLF